MELRKAREKYPDYLANKGERQNLVEHLMLIAAVAKFFTARLGLDRFSQWCTFFSGLLHDIGKVVQRYQLYFSGKDSFDVRGLAMHHELSWYAFELLRRSLRDLPSTLENEEIFWDEVGHLIFYHHKQTRYEYEKGKATIVEKMGDVESRMDKTDSRQSVFDFGLTLIMAAFNDIFPGNGLKLRMLRTEEMDLSSVSKPDLFPLTKKEVHTALNKNSRLHLMRAALVSADHAVSGMKSAELHTLFEELTKAGTDERSRYQIIEKRFARYFDNDPALSPELAQRIQESLNSAHLSGRSKSQVEVALEALEAVTSIYPGPGGIGKTAIAVIYILKSWLMTGRKIRVYWIMPKNEMALNTGGQIAKELDRILGPKHGITTEVFLANRRQTVKGTNPALGNAEAPCSDIIVSNIDFITNCLFTHRSTERIRDYTTAIMIFDEFHEFAMSKPVFFSFLSIMHARHRIAKSRTFLLSATPLPLEEFWNIPGAKGLKTKIIPFDRIPYHHEKKTRVRVVQGHDYLVESRAGFTVLNSTSATVKHHRRLATNHLVHSKFTPEDKKSMMTDVLYEFSKENCIDAGTKVSSALMLQASFDIANRSVVESLCSALKSGQVFFRGNRFGLFDESEFTLVDAAFGDDWSRSERQVIDVVHDRSLAQKWYTFLLEKTGGDALVTGAEFRVFFEDFMASNRDEILAWLSQLVTISMRNLDRLPPLREGIPPDEPPAEMLPASAGNMRNPSGSYYVTALRMEYSGGRLRQKGFLSGEDLFQVGYDEALQIANKLFSEKTKTLKLLKALNERNPDFAYDFNESSLISASLLLRSAKLPTMPLIYSPKDKVYIGKGKHLTKPIGLVSRTVANELFPDE